MKLLRNHLAPILQNAAGGIIAAVVVIGLAAVLPLIGPIALRKPVPWTALLVAPLVLIAGGLVVRNRKLDARLRHLSEQPASPPEPPLHPSVRTILSVFVKKQQSMVPFSDVITKAKLPRLEFKLCMAQLEEHGYMEEFGLGNPLGPNCKLTTKGLQYVIDLGLTYEVVLAEEKARKAQK